MQTEQYLIKINSYNYTDYNSNNITITQQNRQRLIHYYCIFSAVYSYTPGRTAYERRSSYTPKTQFTTTFYCSLIERQMRDRQSRTILILILPITLLLN